MAKSTSTTKAPRTPRRKPPGRPHAITPEVSKRICGLLELGMYAEQAAESAGVSAATYYRWRAAGEEAHVAREVAEREGLRAPAEKPLVKAQREFYEASQRALAGTEAIYLQRIAEAAMGGATFTQVDRTIEHVRKPDGTVEVKVVGEKRTERTLMPDWKAAAWIMSRGRSKDRWAERRQNEVSGRDGAPVEVGLNVGALGVENDTASALVDLLLDDIASGGT